MLCCSLALLIVSIIWLWLRGRFRNWIRAWRIVIFPCYPEKQILFIHVIISFFHKKRSKGAISFFFILLPSLYLSRMSKCTRPDQLHMQGAARVGAQRESLALADRASTPARTHQRTGVPAHFHPLLPLAQ